MTQMPNPEYAHWVTQDHKVLYGIMMLDSLAEVWHMLEEMFTSHFGARSSNIKIALATTKKGTSTMAECFSKMKGYVDEMLVSG
jgi:hypothetical protein